MTDEIERVAEAIRAFERGEIVVVTDDDDRENEGDLFVAASHCTAEKMAFIVRHTSGIVCAPMTAATARAFRLDPMVSANEAPLGTAFTVSVDFRHGLTTGISAEERTATVRALANDNAGPADFVRPGHVFPLIARDGGVLIRSGHTEACVDLCRLASLPQVGVLSELVNDDGTVMRGPQIAEFAENEEIIKASSNAIEAMGYLYQKIVRRTYHVNPNFFSDILHYYPGLLNESYRNTGNFAHQQLVRMAEWGQLSRQHAMADALCLQLDSWLAPKHHATRPGRWPIERSGDTG